MNQGTTKKKYLNNRDLLIEINKSKMTYCYKLDDCFSEYDYIVFDESEINDEIIEKAKQFRIKRINANIVDELMVNNNWTIKKSRGYAKDNNLYIDDVPTDEIVIRVITYEHIPYIEGKDDEHVYTNFTPFKHYIIENGQLIEVVRSHWKGDIDDGEFSQTHGYITNELGKMFIKLTENCARQHNYRLYTYLDDMMGEARVNFVKRALKFDEHLFFDPKKNVKQMNPFSYYTSFVNNAYKAVLNKEKDIRNNRDYMIEESGLEPSFTRQIEIELDMISRKL